MRETKERSPRDAPASHAKSPMPPCKRSPYRESVMIELTALECEAALEELGLCVDHEEVVQFRRARVRILNKVAAAIEDSWRLPNMPCVTAPVREKEGKL